ncbi:hypothetical protein pb186bvf_011759 [Paramecium bursaria]
MSVTRQQNKYAFKTYNYSIIQIWIKIKDIKQILYRFLKFVQTISEAIMNDNENFQTTLTLNLTYDYKLEIKLKNHKPIKRNLIDFFVEFFPKYYFYYKTMVQLATPVNIKFLLTSAAVTILSIIAHANPSSFYYYDFILKNWKLNPITELRLSYKQCEANEIVLSHYLFPGTVAACDCFFSDDFMKYGFPKSPCNEEQLQSGCNNVPPVSSRDFNYYTDPNNQKRFLLCGKQDKSFNFYDFGKYTKSCPKEYNLCGSEQQFVCTKNLKCPISQIGYQDENQKTNNEYIEFQGGLKLWYNRESSIQMPLAETRIGAGDICKDESLLPNTGEELQKDYPLMKQQMTDCERDPRFKFLYKIPEFQLYQINESLDLFQKLPRFQISNYTKYGLYHRGYIEWKQQCKGNIFQKFINFKSQQQQISQFQYILLIFQIITCILIGCLCNIISIVIKNQRFQLINVKLNGIFVSINFLLTTILYSKSKDQVNIAQRVVNLKCTDDFTQSIISELVDNIEYTHNIIFATFAILIIAFFVIVTAIVLLKFNQNQVIEINHRIEREVEILRKSLQQYIISPKQLYLNNKTNAWPLIFKNNKQIIFLLNALQHVEVSQIETTQQKQSSNKLVNEPFMLKVIENIFQILSESRPNYINLSKPFLWTNTSDYLMRINDIPKQFNILDIQNNDRITLSIYQFNQFSNPIQKIIYAQDHHTSKYRISDHISYSDIAYTSFSGSYYQYKYILDNWRQYPITDVRVSQTSNCNSNVFFALIHKEIHLSHYKFPGTVQGCDCTDSDSDEYQGIDTDLCYEGKIEHQCVNMESVSPRNFNFFIDPNYNQRFSLCGSFDSSYTFYDFGKYKDECPQGYKKCGSEQFQTCTKKDKWPIFEFGFQNENQQTQNEYIDFGDGFRFWYNRESNVQMPFVQTLIGEGNGVLNLNYLLLQEDKIIDPRFKLLYKIREDVFYEINDSNDVAEKLPEFQINANYQWGLYNIGYISWKEKCRGEEFVKFIKQQSLYKSIVNYELCMMIFQILAFAGAGYCNFWASKTQVKKIQIYNLISYIMMFLIGCTAAYLIYLKSSNQLSFSRYIAEQNCSDTFTSDIITQLAEDLEQNVYTINYAIFYFLVGVLSILSMMGIFAAIMDVNKLIHANWTASIIQIHQEVKKKNL